MAKLYLQGFGKIFLCFCTSGSSRPCTDDGCINQFDASVTTLSLFSRCLSVKVMTKACGTHPDSLGHFFFWRKSVNRIFKGSFPGEIISSGSGYGAWICEYLQGVRVTSLFFVFVLFWRRGSFSRCISGCHRTCFISQIGLNCVEIYLPPEHADFKGVCHPIQPQCFLSDNHNPYFYYCKNFIFVLFWLTVSLCSPKLILNSWSFCPGLWLLGLQCDSSYPAWVVDYFWQSPPLGWESVTEGKALSFLLMADSKALGMVPARADI